MNSKRSYFLTGLFLLIALLCSCSSLKKDNNILIKEKPEYTGVDRLIKPYVDEYMELSSRNNIVFDNKVTVGFKNIGHGAVIGLCNKNEDFREVDLDINFFMTASELRKKALIFHELTHCYCGRGHDYDAEKPYSENPFALMIQSIGNNIPWTLKRSNPGYFEDGCATSIMHPFIQDDPCLEKHWDHYIKEMFNRCEPY